MARTTKPPDFVCGHPTPTAAARRGTPVDCLSSAPPAEQKRVPNEPNGDASATNQAAPLPRSLDSSDPTRAPSRMPTVNVVISPGGVLRVLSIVVASLIACYLATQVFRVYAGHDHLHGVTPQFNLDRENNLPTWYSLVGRTAVRRATVDPHRHRRKGTL